MKINIIFHSIHAHCYQMAEELKIGAESVPGIEVNIYQVPETLEDKIIADMDGLETKKRFSHIPFATMENLKEADGIILGAPTYFGAPSGQMYAFLNQAGPEWVNGELVGKVGSAFTTSSEQNGGAETTLHSLHNFFYHHGMIIVSVPTSLKHLEMHVSDKPVGGTPYGASMITGGDNTLAISEEEKKIARLQGREVAKATKALCLGRENN